MKTVRRAIRWVGVGLVLLVTACAAPPPAPPPDQMIAQATQKFLRVQSLHFVVEFSGAPTYLDTARTLALRRVEGDIQRPDRMRANLKAALPGAYVLMQAIGIGADQFATNPLNGQWQKIPTEWGFNPALLFDAKTGLGALIGDAQNLAAMPDETIDNQRHYHVRGQIAGEKIAPLTGWLVGTGVVRFETWVGANDGYLRRIRLVDESPTAPTMPGTPMPPAQWNMDFSQFDVPVKIDPPQL